MLQNQCAVIPFFLKLGNNIYEREWEIGYIIMNIVQIVESIKMCIRLNNFSKRTCFFAILPLKFICSGTFLTSGLQTFVIRKLLIMLRINYLDCIVSVLISMYLLVFLLLYNAQIHVLFILQLQYIRHGRFRWICKHMGWF